MKRHMKPKSAKARAIRDEYLKLKADLNHIRFEVLENLLSVASQGFRDKISWDDVYKLNLAQFYLAFEAYYKRIKKFFKDFHHIDLDYKKIDYKELLYDEDGLEFEERLQKHIKKCRTGSMNLIQLGNVYDTILLTEQSCIYHGLQSYAFDDDEFLVFEFIGGCDKCTEDYDDGEVYRHDELTTEPPYHPGCQCAIVDFIAEDDELQDLFPEYVNN